MKLTFTGNPPRGISPFHHPLIPRIIPSPTPSLYLLLFLPGHFLVDIEDRIEEFFRNISRSEPIQEEG
jgi:hypothetical protein